MGLAAALVVALAGCREPEPPGEVPVEPDLPDNPLTPPDPDASPVNPEEAAPGTAPWERDAEGARGAR